MSNLPTQTPEQLKELRKQRINQAVSLLSGAAWLSGGKPVVHAIIIIVALVAGVGSAIFLKKSPAQECLEDTAEQVIKTETGVEVDFSQLRDDKVVK